jgi:hypothetical protein
MSSSLLENILEGVVIKMLLEEYCKKVCMKQLNAF